MTKTAHYEDVGLRWSAAEIEGLVSAFESCTIPPEKWNHHAHLIVAMWYLLLSSEEEAIERMRNGLLRFLDAHGIQTTRERGYHETITKFWIHAVRRYLLSMRENCPIGVLVKGMLERLGDKNLPFAYYSRERLLSWEARQNWIEPDLKSLEEMDWGEI
ncbi:MAG TPA: hypothetical protein VNO70_00885 [Blastocatellia bacterium]|nr:hypothetical protein [Blastocatellia bacterium]